MPKDDFDFDDPMELSGVALFTEEDTTDAMCECFVEEFMRMGYDPQRILALFRNPHYLGMNLVMQQRGEPFIRESIAEVFARWGRPVPWSEISSSRREEAPISSLTGAAIENDPHPDSSFDPTLTDPMGAPIPKLHV